MAVAVRPLAPGDRAEWGAMWHDYLRFYETAVPAAVYDTTFARLVSQDDMVGLVAQDGDRLLGLAHVVFHAHCWRPEGTTYLQDLFTVTDARGRGIGQSLIESVYALADARGRPSVYWTTQDFNHPARRLYDRVGQLSPFIKYMRPT
jgi:GNAT superfamily N-acetyltransferase